MFCLIILASIHLVHLMLDEYAFLVIETQQDMDAEKKLQKALQRHMKNAGKLFSIIVSFLVYSTEI